MNSEQKKATQTASQGKILPAEENVNKAIRNVFKKSLEENLLDAVLMPAKVPDTDSYAWLLIQETSLLDLANPLPPVMTSQGGRALSSLTKHGKLYEQIAAVMKPCEIRAAVELFKLKQIDLDSIILVSIDCPGVVPLSDYTDDSEKMTEVFNEALENWGESDSVRPVCQICHRFSLDSLLPSPSKKNVPPQNGKDLPASDVHLGLMGGSNQNIFVIPVTSKGKEFLEKLGLTGEDSLEDWESKVNDIREKKFKKRKAFNQEWQTRTEGTEKWAAVFDECINCHNCMNVCPVCYCQQCYFDSPFMRLPPQAHLDRAEKRGALRYPRDTLLFHLGRMSHMALSCVSCGACEDACPMSIPVAQVFTMVGDKTQHYFGYTPGRNRGEPLPLQVFVEEEFGEMETPAEGEDTSTGEAKKNV